MFLSSPLGTGRGDPSVCLPEESHILVKDYLTYIFRSTTIKSDVSQDEFIRPASVQFMGGSGQIDDKLQLLELLRKDSSVCVVGAALWVVVGRRRHFIVLPLVGYN